MKVIAGFLNRYKTPAVLPLVFIVALFAYMDIWQRLQIEIDGKVISAQNEHSPGKAPEVHQTKYVFHESSGTDVSYTAGDSDAALEEDMPVGTIINKHKGDFGYFKNGQWVSYPFVPVFGVMIFVILIYPVFIPLFVWRGWDRLRRKQD
jgi:hypothetical protein